MLGIRLLGSEYRTGPKHRGRIDTLGIDENASPVIIEYKRATNENVINQGLFYLDWLLDHQAEFKLMVLEKLGKQVADAIDWSAPRLLCIAGGFTRYDEHAVQQMNRNIELIRYRRFGDGLLMLELINAVQAESRSPSQGTTVSSYPVTRRSPKPCPNSTTHFRTYTKRFVLTCWRLVTTFKKTRSRTISLSSGFEILRA